MIFTNLRLYAIYALIAVAVIGIFVWRVFSAGRNEEKVKSMESALNAIREAAEARANERRNPTNEQTDYNNRDNWPSNYR